MKAAKPKSGRAGRECRNGAKHWMAMCAMSAVVAYAPSSSHSVLAQPGNRVQAGFHSQNPTGTLPLQRYDINPGPIAEVIAAYEKISGIKVVIPSEEIRSIECTGVSGVFTDEGALRRLLVRTGLEYRFTSPQTVTLALQSFASSVDVVGRVDSLSSSKYTEPLLDIPQTIVIIPQSVIEEQGATTLRDVLRNVSGLTITAGEGGTPAGDNLTLRGFSARNDIFVDGARDLSPQSRDPFNLEQVEVVKGPSSAFNGRGSTGGTINLVSKSPALEPFLGLTLNFGTDETKRATADINLPAKRLGLGERSAFRLSLLGHDSGVAGRDVVRNQKWGAAPSLAFGLGTQTRVTLSYYKLAQDNISDYGIPWVPATNNALIEYRDRPAPVPRNTFYGFKYRDFEKLDSDLATIKIEREVGDTFTLRNQFRFGDSTRDSNATPPRFANNSSTVINRELRSWSTKDKIWDNQMDVRAKLLTGSLEHSIVAGLALTHESNVRRTRTGPVSPTTLLNPDPNDVYAGVITRGTIVGDVTGRSAAVYAFDTVKLGKKLELNGGLRWDGFDVDGISTSGAVVRRNDRMTSWRAGAVYKPKAIGSIYAAYGTSLNPSLEGLSYGTANTSIAPERSRNFEIGTKWDLANERLALSAAVFRVEKTNARTPGQLPDDPPQVLEGEQRVNGLEFAVTGSLTRRLRVLGSYTLLDSKVLASNTAAEVNRGMINTPRNSLSIWSVYTAGKLSIGAGPRFVGKRFGNNTNTRFVDGYWNVDGMVSCRVASRLELRLNLFNLNDAYYFDRLGGGHLIPGSSRSAMLSTIFHF